MPLFKKTSDKAKKRLENQLHLARTQPDDVYDISECELYKVPNCVYSEFNVFNKKCLYMQTNKLTSITGKDLKFDDLHNLTLLDVSHNGLKVLPECLLELRNLAHLNCSNNKLTCLPLELGKLCKLNLLHASGNQLKSLPSSVEKLTSLQSLDISNNNVYQLPVEVCTLCSCLEVLVLDTNMMNFPPAIVCENGIVDIMKFLCEKYGFEYQPPDANHDTNDNVTKLKQQENTRHLQEMMLADHENHLKQMQLNESRRCSAIQNLKVNNDKFNHDLHKEQEKKISENKRLLENLKSAEDATGDLLKLISKDMAVSSSKDEIMKCIEEDRINLLNSYLTKKQELRTNDIMGSIEETINNNAKLKASIEKQREHRDNSNEIALSRITGDQMNLDTVLAEKEKDKQNLLDILMDQEEVQKEAFKLLVLQKDDCLNTLTSNIQRLENQLCELTQMEVAQKQNKQFKNSEILVNNRKQLAIMMSNFIEQRQQRNQQIVGILNDMDEERDQTQANYWLYRYQNLMETKAESLNKITNDTDYTIVKLLSSVDAEHLTTVFARHCITVDNLDTLTDDSLKEMGILQVGLRQSILREIEKIVEKRDQSREDIQLRLKNNQDESYIVRPPCIEDKLLAEEEHCSAIKSPTAPPIQENIVAHGLQSECSICMDDMATILFLPCGHICTCKNCSENIKQCPLCRSTIVSRVFIQAEE